jgi:hypothetical protein
MTIHTVSSLRAKGRRLASRVERAELVLGEMRRGAALHLQFIRGEPSWTLSGRPVPPSIAKLVTASASVVGVGDALFDGCSAQTYRWWRT